MKEEIEMAYGLLRWEPFAACSPVQKELNEWLNGFWAPQMDVEETKDEIIVRAELPGMKKEEIKLQTQGKFLVLAGERRNEAEAKDKAVHLVERAQGQFQRVLQLPAEVDASQAKAMYEAGVLTVRLPKREEAKVKEITIEVK